MENWPCRYCEHLKDFSKPREKFIGGCELHLHPETCGKFELAKCFEGHDPRQQEDKSDVQLPECICTDGSIAK